MRLLNVFLAFFSFLYINSQEITKQLLYKVSIDSTNRNNKNFIFKDTPRYIKAIFLPNKKYQVPSQFPLEYYKGKTLEECQNSKYFEVTGYIENEDEFWIHPPRDGDYLKQMEFLPFPNIKYNKKKWSTRLEINSAYFADKRWATWNGDIILYNRYKLTNNSCPIKINNCEYNCTEITAKMRSKLGQTKVIYYFDKNILIKAIYSMLNGDKLELTLLNDCI